jgi:hypothetical protein
MLTKEKLQEKIQELEQQRVDIASQVNRMLGEINGQIKAYQDMVAEMESDE